LDVVVSPTNQSVVSGRTLQFRAQVTGNNNPDQAVSWRVSSNAAGTGAVTQGTSISTSGLLTVSANETLTSLFVIATSVINPSRSGSTSVSIVRPTVTGVTVSPNNQSVTAGRTLQFSAAVTGTNSPPTTVTWRVSSNAAGTGSVTQGTSISSSGLLTVSANETLSTLFVFATSTFDPSRTGSASVSILIPVVTGVVVSPNNQSITTGRTLQFSAAVTGTNNPPSTVTWRVSSNAAGTGSVTQGTSISANGLLTVSPNETVSALFIIATSTFDPARFGSVAVSVNIPTVVTPPPVVTPPTSNITGVVVSPASQSITLGSTAASRRLQFNATVTGSNISNSSVTWSVSSNTAGTGAVTSGTSINSSGLLTISENETFTTLFVIATSVADPSRSGRATVTVNIPVVTPPSATVTAVTVSPATQTITRGNNHQFSASVTGTNNPNTAVTWRVSSNTAGTGAVTAGTSINANGLLTISANETNTTLYVIATSVADTSRSGRATITVNIPPTTPTVTGVTINPATYETRTNTTVQLRATVTGTNNPSTAVTWRVSSTPDGTGAVAPRTTINANGRLTVAPNEWSPMLYVFATSVANPSISGTAQVRIINNTDTQEDNQGS